jgi:hypothetical protein
MTHWVDDYTPLRVMPKVLAAEDYNRIRLGLLRSRSPWRIQLEQPRCLAAILDDTAWVCVDECQNAIPILAWTNFNAHRRAALDTPVECELRLYHMHAGLVMGSVLEALVAAVVEQRPRQSTGDRLVSALPDPDASPPR